MEYQTTTRVRKYKDKKTTSMKKYNYNKITHNTCKCNTYNYYCFCDGEDKLLEKLKNPKNGIISVMYNIEHYAIEYGHSNILKWLHSINYFNYNNIKLSHLFCIAILDRYFNINVVKWFLDNISMCYGPYCKIPFRGIEYLFIINKINLITNEINLQQIERLKILASGVF